VLRRSIRCGAALAVVACLAGCPGRPPPPPNVLVVVVDTLRADKLGAYGNPRGLTPFLDQLAQRGTVFENAYATSSWTIPSVASLFTARYPSQHRVRTFGDRIGDGEVTFAERLRDAGWIGAGYAANPNLQERLGHAQGFAEWRTTDDAKGEGDTLRRWGLDWLDRPWNRAATTPAFLYLHYSAPASPLAGGRPPTSR
jgi:arylsulfatase A-like enzyme